MEERDKMVKVAIMRTAGTNCNEETEHAFKLVGAEVEQLHVNDLIKKLRNLKEFDVVVIPGGFSYGDYVSAGAILASQLNSKLKESLELFVKQGKVLLGICNGFQVLVKTNLLPGNGMKATLTNNDSGNFECRWVKLIDKNGQFLNVPIAHGEGKFIANTETLKYLEENNQVLYKYSGSSFPENPNGSLNDIAGITNKEGNVIGLMPHPERHLSCDNHPQNLRIQCQKAEGLDFFKMILKKAGDKK